LEALSASVILNPVHSKMTRYEMPWKRELYSRGGRTMVSVWNGSGQHESSPPWQIYRDGKDVTGSVREMPSPVPGRPDIRIGVLDVADV
jgi:hypothetical protein